MTLEYFTTIQTTSVGEDLQLIPAPTDPPSTTRRIVRESPLWLPPQLGEKCARTQTWKIDVEFTNTSEIEPLDALVGTHSITVQAGTSRVEGYDDDRIENDPGWGRLKHALEREQWKNPSPQPGEGEFWLVPAGYAAAIKSVTVNVGEQFGAQLYIHIIIGSWSPAYRATRDPDVPGSRPRWIDHGGLEEVWFWQLHGTATAMATDWFAGGDYPVGNLGYVSTSLINYEGEQSGAANLDDPSQDEAFAVTVTHESFFDEV